MEGKIDTGPYQFELIFNDVEELNQKAKRAELHISKLSYHAYAYVSKNYQLLNTGSALGQACGPLLISKQEISFDKIPDHTIAIPGKWTTANLLLSLAFPTADKKVEMLFSDIELSVLTDETDIGLIIHENRFTYQEKGLHKLMDLGEFWENTTGHAIPLGGIAIKREITKSIKRDVDHLIKSSLAYAQENTIETLQYAKQYAQEMDTEVMLKHIELYVNSFTHDLGEEGRKVIYELYEKLANTQTSLQLKQPIFV